MSDVYLCKGEYDKAELPAKRSLKIRKENLFPSSLYIVWSLMNSAIVCLELDKVNEGDQYTEEALHIFDGNVVDPHQGLVRGLKKLAAVYERKGKSTKAQLLSKYASEIGLQTQGEPLVPFV